MEFKAVGKEVFEGHTIFTLYNNWKTSIFECKSGLKEINVRVNRSLNKMLSNKVSHFKY